MPSPSDSSSVVSVSGSRALSGSRRGMSTRGGARLLLYLGLCHLSLGAMVLAFSFTSLAFTSSPRIRQSCPLWAGFFVVASGVVGVISWRRPLTLVVCMHKSRGPAITILSFYVLLQVSLFMLLSAVCVILSLAGSMLSCQNAQLVKSLQACQVEDRVCWCCSTGQACTQSEDTLVLYPHADCHSVRHQLKDLLFSACGLSILSTIVCTLSTVTCSIHIFSLDLLHLLAPHRSRSVNPECTTPQDAFLTNILDFEEFVPPIPPPPYYPPEYTCSSETDAQSITYNGSMESPVPLYPTDCPPPYEAVMGQRVASQATVYDAQGTELSCERGTSTAFSGEASMDSGSLLMSEIVDIPDDSSPSEDSCLMEVGLGGRGRSSGGEGGEYVSFRCPAQSRPPSDSPSLCPQPHRCFRGERSNSCSSPSSSASHRSPILRHQAILASSCSQLETLGGSGSQRSSVPEIRVRPSSPSRRGSDSLAPPTASPALSNQGTGPPVFLLPPYPRRRQGARDRCDSDSLPPLVRSHSEPGLTSSTDTGDFTGSSGCKGVSAEGSQTSTDTGPSSEACLLPRSSLVSSSALPRKGSMKVGTELLPSKPAPPASPLRLPKDCARSLGDLKVTRVLVARFLQRSKRNLAPPLDHVGGGMQGPKRRAGSEAGGGHRPFEQVLRNSWGATRGQQYQQHSHHRTHHHSQSESHSRRSETPPVPMEGIHLRSCGDLSSSSAVSLRRLLSRPHGSSGTLYTESAL